MAHVFRGRLADNPFPRIILPHMLFLLSPAKALDFKSPVSIQSEGVPRFVPQAKELVRILAQLSPVELARLMNLSDKLAALNVARFQAWQVNPKVEEIRAAVLAFDGDVYDGLNAKSLKQESIEWLQRHLRILSGLYGILRPLDPIQPYRLEMGTRLNNPKGVDLYQYWGDRISGALRADMTELGGEQSVINLASIEYFKSAQALRKKTRVIDCIFEERRGSGYSVVSFYAKKARGMMMRFAAEHQVESAEELKAFDSAGYAFSAGASLPDRWVFRRDTVLGDVMVR